jgi:alpha-galactosidase
LTIEAIMKRDRELLVRALSIDPLVNSIATARVLIDELYHREKEALPGWLKPDTDDTASSVSETAPELVGAVDVKNY